MTNLTTPAVGYDRSDDRWVINGDRLDFGGALRVLRCHMGLDEALAMLTGVLPSAAERQECQTVTVPETAEWSVGQGSVAIYSAPDAPYPSVRIDVPSEEAARALLQAAQAEARRWGLVL